MTTEKQAVQNVQVQSAVYAYVQHLTTIGNGQYMVNIEPGRKFYKITQQLNGSHGRSVHAFVDKQTGGLYKAASWAQPAKGVRYDLLREFSKVTQVADIYGGYLYKDRAK